MEDMPQAKRCDCCQRISIDSTNGASYRAVPLLSEKDRPPIGIMHQPGLRALQDSATEGCDLCRVFEDALRQSWDLTPFIAMEQAGQSMHLHVRSDIYLPGLMNTIDFGDIASHLTIELRVAYNGVRDNEVVENPYVTFQIYIDKIARLESNLQIIS